MKKIVARIFEDVGGYYVCGDNLDFLDTRGHAYGRKIDAMRAAVNAGYTHAIGSGTYWGNEVRSLAKYSD